jgi:hypothetical protein
MDKEQIKRLVIEEGLTIKDLIDVVIDLNGFVGVGLISLEQDIAHYIREHKGA